MEWNLNLRLENIKSYDDLESDINFNLRNVFLKNDYTALLRIIGVFHCFTGQNCYYIYRQLSTASMLKNKTAWKREYGATIIDDNNTIKILKPKSDYSDTRKIITLFDFSNTKNGMLPEFVLPTRNVYYENILRPFKINEAIDFDVCTDDDLFKKLAKIALFYIRKDAEDNKWKETDKYLSNSIAYAICCYFDLDCDDDIFNNIDKWAKQKETDDLLAYLRNLRDICHKMIECIIEGNDILRNMCIYHANKCAMLNGCADFDHQNQDKLFKLAISYYTGTDCAQNYQMAFDLFQKLYQVGHQEAGYHLGLCYLNGYGTLNNDEEAFECFYMASRDNGIVNAQYELANCYNYGIGVDVDKNEAYEWYGEAAARGNKYAQFEFGAYLLKADNEHIVREGIKNLEWAAESGVAKASLALAKYYDGNGDSIATFKWYKIGASLGNLESLFQLGKCYDFGKGTDIDYQKAFNSYFEAAKGNHPDAMYEVARDYEKGWGVDSDEKMAKEWYMRAAEGGVKDAQYWIGHCLMDENSEEAVKWLTEAANNDHISAQYELAEYYRNAEDHESAFELYLKSAKSGHAVAQYWVANYYNFYSDEVESNIELALKWYLKSADGGIIQAKYEVGLLYLDKSETENAKLWILQAAEDDYPEAQCKYAEILLSDVTDNKHFEVAIKWLNKALINANDFFYEPLYQLALCYYYGMGVLKNHKLALDYLNRIKTGLDCRIQLLRGLIYLGIYDTSLKDYEKAFFNFEKASKSRVHPVGVYNDFIIAEANYYLGDCYCYGYGTAKDIVKSALCYKVSIKYGYLNAYDKLSRLETEFGKTDNVTEKLFSTLG